MPRTSPVRLLFVLFLAGCASAELRSSGDSPGDAGQADTSTVGDAGDSDSESGSADDTDSSSATDSSTDTGSESDTGSETDTDTGTGTGTGTDTGTGTTTATASSANDIEKIEALPVPESSSSSGGTMMDSETSAEVIAMDV